MRSQIIRFFLFLIISAKQAYPCLVTIPHYIVKWDASTLSAHDINDSYIGDNCNTEMILGLFKKIINYPKSGPIDLTSPEFLNFLTTFKIDQSTTEVLSINQFVNMQLNTDSFNVYLDIQSTPSHKKFISANSFEEIEVSCPQSCTDNVTINSANTLTISKRTTNEIKNLTFGYSVLKKISALKSKGNIGVLDRENLNGRFEIVEVFVKNPNDFMTDISALRFYQLNKTMNAGDLLQIHDLSSKYLVKTGQPVKVLAGKDGLALSTNGMAKRNGKIKEVIDVYLASSKNTISAQVEDLNIVRVIE